MHIVHLFATFRSRTSLNIHLKHFFSYVKLKMEQSLNQNDYTRFSLEGLQIPYISTALELLTVFVCLNKLFIYIEELIRHNVTLRRLAQAPAASDHCPGKYRSIYSFLLACRSLVPTWFIASPTLYNSMISISDLIGIIDSYGCMETRLLVSIQTHLYGLGDKTVHWLTYYETTEQCVAPNWSLCRQLKY